MKSALRADATVVVVLVAVVTENVHPLIDCGCGCVEANLLLLECAVQTDPTLIRLSLPSEEVLHANTDPADLRNTTVAAAVPCLVNPPNHDGVDLAPDDDDDDDERVVVVPRAEEGAADDDDRADAKEEEVYDDDRVVHYFFLRADDGSFSFWEPLQQKNDDRDGDSTPRWNEKKGNCRGNACACACCDYWRTLLPAPFPPPHHPTNLYCSTLSWL